MKAVSFSFSLNSRACVGAVRTKSLGSGGRKPRAPELNPLALVLVTLVILVILVVVAVAVDTFALLFTPSC